MSPTQPVGEPLPGMGELPAQVAASAPDGSERPFSVYLHVPYCRVRCGYCDFNTYTNLTMGQGASAEDFVGTLAGELRAARRAMDEAGLPVRAAQTVFVGGGTFGMQSAVPHVLKVLERTHEPARVPRVVEWARRAGLSTSLDLIYGAPGESLEDWQRSLDAVTRIGPDHVSAYALVIEEGTRMWGQVRRGELPMPEDDDEATKYEMADAALRQAGYEWYEISNWARPGAECRHNQAYWLDWDWWGAGPGAHSHLGDVRLWNTKHPVAWAGQIATGHLPVAGHEAIDADSRELERIMLGIRLREGIELASRGNRPDCPSADRPDRGRATPPHLVPVVAGLVGDGLLDAGAALRGRAVLTLRGRLMADTVTRALTQ